MGQSGGCSKTHPMVNRDVLHGWFSLITPHVVWGVPVARWVGTMVCTMGHPSHINLVGSGNEWKEKNMQHSLIILLLNNLLKNLERAINKTWRV